jgi:hypothetical protein
MTKNKAKGNGPKQPPKPRPELKRLEKLVGKWNLKGRTPGFQEDNVTGWNTFEWMLDGFFLKSTGELDFGGFKIQSVEIIGYDPTSQTFRSSVYTNMSGAMLPYEWDVQGNQVTHWMDTAKYMGTFSDDGRLLTGGWRPVDGKGDSGNVAWDAVMIRVD